MERDAHYGAVGAFVLVVIAMATVFVLWYTNAQERREYRRYEVYFTGSVSGLNEGSTVRYLGVNVGRVWRIRIDPRNSTRVLVLVDVDAATPVDRTTLARLSMQGVTGLLFIDLLQETPDTRGASEEVPSQNYPVIRSVPSGLDLFLAGLPELVAQATRVTYRLNQLLSEDNLRAMNATIASLEKASATLPQTGRDVQRLVADLHEVASEAQATARGLHELTATAGPSIATAAQRLVGVSDSLARTSGRLDALLARHEQDFDRFASEGLGEVASLVRESRAAAAEIAGLARTLKENPGRILYPPRAQAVEIAP
jgi:phospholipid/cholesterol/gamma-HCH transport system substrate-binding protein